MILRAINTIVIVALVVAAAWVYRIKYDSAVQAEHLAKLRSEVRHERDKIAALRAQWSSLDDPARIEALTKRFLKLHEIAATQFDTLDHLPDQPPEYLRPGAKDPIGGMIEHLEEEPLTTGSIPAPGSPPTAVPPPEARAEPGADRPGQGAATPPAAAPTAPIGASR